MQEEVENKTLTLIINSAKFSGRTLQNAIGKYLAHCKNVSYQKKQKRDSPVIPKGKQSVKQLVGQGQGVSNIEIDDPSIRQFDRIARKYGVDYAVKKDRTTDPPRFLVFFKAKDADALTAAFNEYAGKKVKKASRPSVREKLAHFKDMVKDTAEKVKKKVLER